MHLADGIVPVEMALAGYAASAALTGVALSRINRLPDSGAGVPRAAMLVTVFFAASLIAIPVPPASAHLMLAGLMGVCLGWYAMPAILVGLFLQAVMFGHGGITTLGLNGLIFGLPALAAFGLWTLLGRRWPTVAALVAGGGAVSLALALFILVVMAGLSEGVSAAAETVALQAIVLAHLPIVVAESVIVLVALRVLRRVEPRLVLAHG